MIQLNSDAIVPKAAPVDSWMYGCSDGFVAPLPYERNEVIRFSNQW